MLVNSVTPAEARGHLLDVRNLCVSFYDGEVWRETLKDVSFAVEPGEVVGIVGESGCGKSLTALSILGLLPRHGARLTGEMHFEGRDLAKLSEREMRDVRGRRIGMVFQEPMSALDPVFPVGEQIAETVRRHFRVDRTGSERARRRGARGGRHRVAAAGRQDVSGEPLGRHAPARADRDGAGVRTAPADRGRADHRTRRHHSGADHGSAAGARPAHRHRDPVHHSQSRPRRRKLPAHADDVCRPGGRGRPRARHPQPPVSSLHGRPAGLDPARCAAQDQAVVHSRARALDLRDAGRLPVRAALRAMPSRAAASRRS